jgi:hypothetical protein
MKRFFAGVVSLGMTCSALLGTAAQAQGFSALVSPPRVEMKIKPGQGARQVIEITQVGNTPGRFRIYTNDWQLDDQGGVKFFNELQAGSCRPWVALERREINVSANNKVRFRFEVSPPADAPVAECRFAIMVEGLDTSKINPGSLSFPVSGRIGVIVYAGMEGTKPELKIIGQSVQAGELGAVRLPVITVRNEGNAHGRLNGLLTGVDANGNKIDFSPNTLPILAGETRQVTLLINPDPNAPKDKPLPMIRYPLSVKGNLEWGERSQPFDALFNLP